MSATRTTRAHAAPSPRPGRRERRRRETYERLFQCALRLFQDRGFLATTVEDITEAADVGKGTFFNYFRSKEDVLSALAEFQLGKYQEAISAAREGRLTPRQALKELYFRLPQEPGRTPALVRSLMAVFLTSDMVRAKVMQGLERGRGMLAELFALAQQQREVQRGRKPAELALAFQQSLLGTMLVWTLHPPVKLRPWLEASFEHFWNGARDPRTRS